MKKKEEETVLEVEVGQRLVLLEALTTAFAVGFRYEGGKLLGVPPEHAVMRYYPGVFKEEGPARRFVDTPLRSLVGYPLSSVRGWDKAPTFAQVVITLEKMWGGFPVIVRQGSGWTEDDEKVVQYLNLIIGEFLRLDIRDWLREGGWRDG